MPEMTQGSGIPKVVIAGATRVTPRGPESTIAQTGATTRDPPHDTRAARLLLGVTLSTAVTLGVLGVVLLQLIVALATQQQQRAEPARAQCRDGVDSECEAGEVCEGGRCVPAKQASSCQVGDPCGGPEGCTCAAGLTCVEGQCAAPTAAAICGDPAVAGLLRGISEVCNGDIHECPPEKLEKYAISAANFDEVMSKFPATITLHFPDGNPRVRGWPSAAARAYYEQRLKHPAVLRALMNAEDILLLGRSSEGGSVTENHTISRERAGVVRDLLVDLAPSQSERSELTRKIYLLLMSNDRLLDANFFASRYANRLIAWSSEIEGTLRANIQGYAGLRGREGRWTRNTMNQVVVIVPLPCKLPRAEATPSPPAAIPTTQPEPAGPAQPAEGHK